MDFTLKTMPLSTNHLYAHSGRMRFMTSKGKENKESIQWETRTQYRGVPLQGSIRLTVALYWGDKRKHDTDNIKILLDAFTGILYEDDGQIEDLHIRKYYEKENPRVEISVASL